MAALCQADPLFLPATGTVAFFSIMAASRGHRLISEELAFLFSTEPRRDHTSLLRVASEPFIPLSLSAALRNERHLG